MIRKLRIKLVLASMLSLLLVLVIIFSIVGVLNYVKVTQNADEILTLLALNDGHFGGNDDRKGEAEPPEDLHKQGHRFSAEIPYETRYFSVFLKQDGSVTAVNTGKIAAVDTAAAVEYAQTVAASQREKGFVDHYRYIVIYGLTA